MAFLITQPDVEASDWKIYAGISDKMTVDLNSDFKDTARALQLKIVVEICYPYMERAR